MNLQNQKTKSVLGVLGIIEFFYLIVSIIIVFSGKIPQDLLQLWLRQWVFVSYFVLPILLFKNIVLALYNNGALSKNQKAWTLVRCIVYFALSFFAYPLILSL